MNNATTPNNVSSYVKRLFDYVSGFSAATRLRKDGKGALIEAYKNVIPILKNIPGAPAHVLLALDISWGVLGAASAIAEHLGKRFDNNHSITPAQPSAKAPSFLGGLGGRRLTPSQG
ncbi:MAG: hypothetical protein PHS57_07480 [Alphaproteobacteria bacterium]|nr:hypothetical protein [Alphaproteobacteria bacterium]